MQETHPHNGEQAGFYFYFSCSSLMKKGCCASMEEVDGFVVLCDLRPCCTG